MREILFKAKRMDTGEWVAGFPFPSIPGKELNRMTVFEQYSGGTVVNTYKIDPSTVCQYTGLKDENGKKIFEHDILSAEENGEPEGIIEYGSWNCGCCYDVYGFYGISKKGICDTKMTLYHNENERIGIYVVGNIHDREE